MFRTSAQLAAEREEGQSPASRSQGTEPFSFGRDRQGSNPSALERGPSPKNSVSHVPVDRGAKRPIDTEDYDPAPSRLRQQDSRDIQDRPATNCGGIDKPIDPIEFWAREGIWPSEYFNTGMERVLAQKKPLSTPSRSTSRLDVHQTRGDKTAPYRELLYEEKLEQKGSFMHDFSLGIVSEDKMFCQTLLQADQAIPDGTLFSDSVFADAYRTFHGGNEARIFRDISLLIVPSAAHLTLFGGEHLKMLREGVDHGWNCSIPVTGTRPQPDYSVGFGRRAFSPEQLAKMSPCLGDYLNGDRSFFLATYYMFFPFLTCEVQCGNAALDIADRQNAHSMTLAVRAVAELFRAVKRESEVHRHILAFSVSHDDHYVRIYGHYPVIDDGDNIKYYRHTIRRFDFTDLDGKEKWTAYRFIRNVYDKWMPFHFKRICSAIEQLPDEPEASQSSPQR